MELTANRWTEKPIRPSCSKEAGISAKILTRVVQVFILPFIANSSIIFFFRQYLTGLPKSLIEEARINGETEYEIFKLIKKTFIADSKSVVHGAFYEGGARYFL